ncbi:sigma-70 family RNA polymerase sigma factor [Marinilactibacillus psychrotolerans]|uniref:sigma-70 family RNA polymerase sigma factor n=1 Tax=Marinilactibacillus psychrotolerans TaxID=191770 RepID=UPI003885A5F3
MSNIKFQWLKTLFNIDEELTDIQVQKKIHYVELKRWENHDDGTDGDLAKNQTYIVSIHRQENIKKVIDTLNEREKKLQKQRDEVIELIEKFEGLDNQILKLKYVKGLTLENVANELGYDYQYIKNKHAQLMKMIRFTKEVK